MKYYEYTRFFIPENKKVLLDFFLILPKCSQGSERTQKIVDNGLHWRHWFIKGADPY